MITRPLRVGMQRGSLCLLLACIFLLHPNAGVQAKTRQDGPPGNPTTWQIQFDDEFNGTSLDTTKWNYCYYGGPATGCTGGNGEMEWYVPSAVSVQSGLLWVQANNQPVQDAKGNTHQYTSGLIQTAGKFDFLYGYMEARFKVPAGQALWPAFWALPLHQENTVNPSLPDPTELDAMEILGQLPNQINMVVHYTNQYGYALSNDNDAVWNGPDFSAAYHTVGLDWEPTALTWYVDGVARLRLTNTAMIPRKEMYIILDLAVGGNWPGAPDATTPFPSNFSVDWVRVWKHVIATTPTVTGSATTIPTSTPQGGAASTAPGGPTVPPILEQLLLYLAIAAFLATVVMLAIMLRRNRTRPTTGRG
jgi:beta-glucanase (GH16 family)